MSMASLPCEYGCVCDSSNDKISLWIKDSVGTDVTLTSFGQAEQSLHQLHDVFYAYDYYDFHM